MKTRLIVFDLDGTLVDCRDLHYVAFNSALKENGQQPISYDDHLTKFDGLNTKAKLDLLGIKDRQLRDDIFADKQIETITSISTLKPSERIWATLGTLRFYGFKLCVATNSIKETAIAILQHMRILEFFDCVASNQDVFHPKPAPDVYSIVMLRTACSNIETLIVEDSDIGVAAAAKTGAIVMQVKDSSEVTFENIMKYVEA